MICISLSEPTLACCLSALVGVPFAEIRMDRMRLSTDDVSRLFSSHKNLIATCRPGPMADEERKSLLVTAIDAGAAYVDLEVDSPTGYREEILSRARQKGCKAIVSFHDHEKTPDRTELEGRLAACFQAGADIAKVACKVHTDRDNVRILALLDHPRPVVAIGMGERGRISRVLGPLLGSPFTFASAGEGKETAEGQMDGKMLSELIEILQKRTGHGGHGS
jgi:3-dehydroquinate dehydratase I